VQCVSVYKDHQVLTSNKTSKTILFLMEVEEFCFCVSPAQELKEVHAHFLQHFLIKEKDPLSARSETQKELMNVGSKSFT